MSGLGDTLPGNPKLPGNVDPAVFLVAQVNRFFTSGAPWTGLAGVPFPMVAGQIPQGAAMGAVIIAQKAEADAFSAFADPTSGGLVDGLDAAMANPSAFVSTNLPWVAATIAAYGDSLGLSAAKLPGQALPGVDNRTLIMAGLGALALFLFVGGK
jgi:hypothetical protein